MSFFSFFQSNSSVNDILNKIRKRIGVSSFRSKIPHNVYENAVNGMINDSTLDNIDVKFAWPEQLAQFTQFTQFNRVFHSGDTLIADYQINNSAMHLNKINALLKLHQILSSAVSNTRKSTQITATIKKIKAGRLYPQAFDGHPSKTKALFNEALITLQYVPKQKSAQVTSKEKNVSRSIPNNGGKIQFSNKDVEIELSNMEETHTPGLQ
jgi:hypothetical protein